MERWDVAFAELYLTALDLHLSGGTPSRPWRLAFDAPDDLPALRLVLLGINAHVNYDLPQALLAVITDEDFDDVAADGAASPRPRAHRRRAREPCRGRGRPARHPLDRAPCWTARCSP